MDFCKHMFPHGFALLIAIIIIIIAKISIIKIAVFLRLCVCQSVRDTLHKENLEKMNPKNLNKTELNVMKLTTDTKY